MLSVIKFVVGMMTVVMVSVIILNVMVPLSLY
jgi:hypothetical protein